MIVLAAKISSSSGKRNCVFNEDEGQSAIIEYMIHVSDPEVSAALTHRMP